MGAGIAVLAALAGVAVVLVDAHAPVLARARTRILRDAERAGDASAAERVALSASLDDIAAAEIVIEAVPEDLELKQRLFAELETRVSPEALLATNTSALSVEAIAASIAQRERMLGLHFFNPPTAMKLVEVVRLGASSSEAIERANAFVKLLGHTPILVTDTPGFVVNRVARPFYLQSLRALELGVGTPAALDALARGVGFPMGPFALMDLIGLDVNLATSQAVFERTGAARLEPAATQLQMVAAGRLGRKTGDGFYHYDENAVAQASPPPFVRVHGRGERSPLVVLDPDGVLAPLATAAGERGILAYVAAELEEAARYKMPVVFDAYRFNRDDLHRAGIAEAAGVGVVGPLRIQKIVELVVDPGHAEPHDFALPLLAAADLQAIAVAPAPGLYLGRTIASIVNEAAFALEEKVASVADIDLALRLGVRYPMGPFEWAERIGFTRIVAILDRLAREDSPAYGPAAWFRR